MEVDFSNRRVANVAVGNRAAALVLQTEWTVRGTCMATGSDKIAEPDAVGRVLQVSRREPWMPFLRGSVRFSHLEELPSP